MVFEYRSYPNINTGSLAQVGAEVITLFCFVFNFITTSHRLFSNRFCQRSQESVEIKNSELLELYYDCLLYTTVAVRIIYLSGAKRNYTFSKKPNTYAKQH